MKVMMCHDYYQQRGGEDEVFEAEANLLGEHGHEVIRHTVHNDSIGRGNRLATGAGAVWNVAAQHRLRALLRQHRPDIVHCYNTFPLFSPAIYYTVKAAGLPLVQSLHNFRLLCLNAAFYRDGAVCEDCLRRTLPLPGIRHRCYRGSRLGSLSVAAMQVTHRVLRSWHRKVDVFLLGSTQFALERFIRAGFPAEAFVLKPNFVHPDPGMGQGGGGYALFVGRFDVTKGIDDMLQAWRSLAPAVPLKIVGDGPLAVQVRAAAQQLEQVEWLGRKPLNEVHGLMQEARLLVFPSRWYEAMPRTIIDSFAVGTPVLAARMGAMRDLVQDGRSGLLFEPGNVDDLAAKARRLYAMTAGATTMRDYARQVFLENFTAAKNYDLIMQAYARAVERNGA